MDSEASQSDQHSTKEEASDSEQTVSDEESGQTLSPFTPHEGTMLVKVYGLLGHTRCVDLEFDATQVQAESIFVFQGKRYKIASVIETATHQTAINAVSMEYQR